MKKAVAVIALVLALAGCGSRQVLKPKTGESLPPKAAAAKAPATPEALMTPDTQARPQRTDELITRSQKRQPDPFDLPPPG